MKKHFMAELEDQINIHNVKNKKEILAKYSKRYDFGIEAGMTEEEVEMKLGSPEDIIKDYIVEEVEGEIIDFTDDYQIRINTISDDIDLVYSKDSNIHVELEDIDEALYDIDKSGNNVNITFKKTKFFSLNRRRGGTIRVEIPKEVKLKSVVLGTNSGDISTKSFKTEKFKYNSVSGEGSFEDLEADDFTFYSVSGDGKFKNVKAKYAKIDTVSGDLEIKFLIGEEAKISTVTGDVIIRDGKIDNISSSSVSGDIVINGEPVSTNMKNYVKGLFRK